MTKIERYTLALLNLNYEVVHETTVRKYKVFRKPGDTSCIFLGKSGAIRVGRTVSSSIPMSEAGIIHILTAGAANG